MIAVERAPVGQMTLEEFIRLYDRDNRFELIDGERIPLMPTVAIHSVFIRTMFLILYQHAVAHTLGEVFTETTFVLMHGSAWVKGSRVPDLLFISAAKWEQYTTETPDWEGKPIAALPDLVVEIVSPNDLYSDIQARVDRYLADGVALVWVVDPGRAVVLTYAVGQYHTLGKDETLTGGDVLPGLAIPLKELFK
jgi:Uma2 family endonuclease